MNDEIAIPENNVNPKGAGRPKGIKDKKPRITSADMKRAEMMFITGTKINTIKKTLGLTSSNAIYKRMEKEGWLEKREKYLTEREENYLKTVMEKSIKETNDVLDDLKIIKSKALDGVSSVDIDKVRLGEATQSYIGAIEMERRVRSEGIELGFVSIIAKILKEEVQDPIILAKVADKLKEEFDKYRGRPLLQAPIAQKIEDIDA